MSRRILWTILAVVAVVVIAGGYYLWQQNRVRAAADDAPTAVVERGTLRVAVSASGQTEPEERVNQSFELPARVESAALADGRLFSAGAFVAAAGCWLQDLLGPLGVASAVYPKKRQLFAFELDEPALIYGEEGAGRPATILPYGGVYLKPVLERGLMVAGRADDFGRAFELPYEPVEPGAGRPAAEEEYFRSAVEPIIRAYFPALARRYADGLRLKQAWAGHYDYHLPDKNPVLERAANLWWIGGSSGSGIMKGDALGRAAAAAALGRGEVELADGRRFRPASLSLKERAVDAEGMVI